MWEIGKSSREESNDLVMINDISPFPDYPEERWTDKSIYECFVISMTLDGLLKDMFWVYVIKCNSMYTRIYLKCRCFSYKLLIKDINCFSMSGFSEIKKHQVSDLTFQKKHFFMWIILIFLSILTTFFHQYSYWLNENESLPLINIDGAI